MLLGKEKIMLRPGTVVRLKSGGPDMSVKEDLGSVILCQWFVGCKLESAFFPMESLCMLENKADAARFSGETLAA